MAPGFAERIDGDKLRPNVTRLSGLNPGSTFQIAVRLRIIKPAPINNTNAIAISAATNTPCARTLLLVVPRALSLRVSLNRLRDVLRAGAIPARIPVRIETVAVKINTR